MDDFDDIGMPKDPILEDILGDPLAQSRLDQRLDADIYEDTLSKIAGQLKSSIEGTEILPEMLPDFSATDSLIKANLEEGVIVRGTKTPGPQPPDDFTPNEPMHPIISIPPSPRPPPFGRVGRATGGGKGFRDNLRLRTSYGRGFYRGKSRSWKRLMGNPETVYCPERQEEVQWSMCCKCPNHHESEGSHCLLWEAEDT